jgi:ABC-2 type transport system permease protein
MIMHYLKLIGQFAWASVQNELAYRANFWISLLHSLLNLITGVLGVLVIFGQVDSIRGWDMPSTLALLGVYLTLSALRDLFLGPSLEALAGMDGEIWTGQFDFTLLRPVNAQFLASVRHWRPFALVDLVLGMGVLSVAISHVGQSLTPSRLAAFALTLVTAVVILYALLLIFSALVLWSPGFLFTWLFDGLFRLARYPVGLYPGWLRLVLTWIVPVGVMTTVPAQALTGALPFGMLAAGSGLAAALFVGSSVLFRFGLRRYASASS